MLERRSNAAEGWVNFPIDNPQYEYTGDGGMIVKLVVVDDHEMEAPEHFAKCTGVQVRDLLTECLVGDDQLAYPEDAKSYESVATIRDEEQARVDWVRRHYPGYRCGACDPIEADLSRDYLAVIVMGSTGWSGMHAETGNSWACTVEDLTVQGKALYDQVAALYPNAALHLLTFLDT